MPCTNPMQAQIVYDRVDLDTGERKARLQFLHRVTDKWKQKGDKPADYLPIPCGKCMYCRIKKSREWAARAYHENQLYINPDTQESESCFLTFTYDDESLHKLCELHEDDEGNSSYSLDSKYFSKFIKNFRRQLDYHYDKKKIRYLYCGEYGPGTLRPHYHMLCFGFNPPDKVHYKTVTRGTKKYRYYNSEFINRIWGNGYVVVGEVTYESAAYCARYVTKKYCNDKNHTYYYGREPEFARMSNKPGLGSDWFDKYNSDIYTQDIVVLPNGGKLKPPRYYDTKLKNLDPSRFEQIKNDRQVGIEKYKHETTWKRLKTKEKCYQRKYDKLIRNII